jgi:D-aminopeptidase
VPEGNVGGGTGMITADFKAGIGTSSRRLPPAYGGFTLGVLVMSNFGHLHGLRFGGYPVGEYLAPLYAHVPRRRNNYGSIIAVVATDAPLMTHQLNRLAKRAALGVGRTGSYAAHGSGEIVLAFSTANKVPRASGKLVYRAKFLVDERMDPLYEAVIECVEEAILNSLCMARPMDGINGNYAPALPLAVVRDYLRHVRRPMHAPEPGTP